MKASEMAEMLSAFFSPWPHVVVNELMVQIWLLAFPNETKENFLAAGVAALKIGNNGFPITIDKVCDMLAQLKMPATDKITEGEAWMLLHKAISYFGRGRPTLAMQYLEERSPWVAGVAQQLGWNEICNWKHEDESANRAHFFRLYGALQKRDQQSDKLGLPRQHLRLDNKTDYTENAKLSGWMTIPEVMRLTEGK